MRPAEFQNLLFRSAVMVMSCDGEIADAEVTELKTIVENEIYFLGYDYAEPLVSTVVEIKRDGKDAINRYLNDLAGIDLSQKQKFTLMEVVIRMIEADSIVQPSEVQFLHLVKSKLKVSEKDLIVKFPKQIGYLISNDLADLSDSFTQDFKLK